MEIRDKLVSEKPEKSTELAEGSTQGLNIRGNRNAFNEYCEA